MISKSLVRRQFSQIGRAGLNVANTWNRIKKSVMSPKKHLKRMFQSEPGHNSPLTNTTAEAFDEVSQEWQALIIGNPYDLQTYNYLEQVSSNNFGTVDNPHVVFTADAPFRYVVCCGPADIDDYEGHEALYFMLREGPLQRCQGCGQVFKLVRLRDEFSAEMDYYQSNFLPYEFNEMGEQENFSTLSPLRFVTQYEPTHFEMPSNVVYTLVNNDDHDRILVDPKYRMQKLKEIQDIDDIYNVNLEIVNKQIDEQKRKKNKELYGNEFLEDRVAMNKQEFVTMLEIEQTINKLDRVFQRVEKFVNRQIIDPDNYERREKRMLERQRQRWDDNYTLFLGGLTEQEQQYRDYYQTDLELEPDNELVEEQLDLVEQMQSEQYRLQRFDFQELYTNNPEDDQQSFINRKLFRMKYRMFEFPINEHYQREQRMIQASVARYNKTGRALLEQLWDSINRNDQEKEKVAMKEWSQYQVEEGIRQYKDYFQEDPDIEALQKLAVMNANVGIEFYQNFMLNQEDDKKMFMIPKRKWNPSMGVWQNFLFEMKDFNNHIIPRTQQLSDQSYSQKFRPIGEEELAELQAMRKKISGK